MVQKRTKGSDIMMTKVMIITLNAIMEGLKLVEGGSQEMVRIRISCARSNVE